MDQETANYIITYFAHLLTGDEKLAIRHNMSILKLQDDSSDNEARIRMYKKIGWLTESQDVLNLLREGYDSFEIRVANRILSEHKDDVFLNKCPQCGKLARTPQARQCRHCGHDWHDLTVAQFMLSSSFQLIGRSFFLLGKITEGEVKIGNYIDLTMLGLNKKPKIEAIEFALKQKDGTVWEDIALGINELNETDKAHLIRIGTFSTPLDIVKEK